MRKPLSACLLALALVAGCTTPVPPGGGQPTGSTSSAVQGGTEDTTHTFAVGIVVETPMGTAVCSGALLAPNLVATARHCAANISADQIDCSTATFGTDFAARNFVVTTDSDILQATHVLYVSKVVTPTPTGVCGDDLALLILSSNVELPQYVTPVINPPMTDHTMYSEQITAIGYGIDSPTDDAGTSAGIRRIRQDLQIACIPDDTTYTDCFPSLTGIIAASEFEVAGGTCEGDSGSSAYDQQAFSQGSWTSFGVLSRGGVSADGQTCEGAIYTRFDAYGQLLTDTVREAAQMGGYALPVWAGGSPSASSSSSNASSGSSGGTSSSGSGLGSGSSGGAPSNSTSSGATQVGENGVSCKANSDCASNNCVSADNGQTYVCASSCTTSAQCPSSFTCDQGYCIAEQVSTPFTTTSQKSGCAVASLGSPTEPVPWRAGFAAVAAGAVALRRRRRL
jgi:hypothetical protein